MLPIVPSDGFGEIDFRFGMVTKPEVPRGLAPSDVGEDLLGRNPSDLATPQLGKAALTLGAPQCLDLGGRSVGSVRIETGKQHFGEPGAIRNGEAQQLSFESVGRANHD